MVRAGAGEARGGDSRVARHTWRRSAAEPSVSSSLRSRIYHGPTLRLRACVRACVRACEAFTVSLSLS
jgi:hypothetical protein